MAMMAALSPPAMGTVTAQAKMMLRKRRQSTPALDVCAQPTNTTEPTLQWVVLMGKPILDATRTVKAAPISMVKPLDAVSLVRSSPMVLMTRRPQTHRPTAMPKPP